MRIAALLHLYRKGRKLSLRGLAHETGIHYLTLQRIEGGHDARPASVARLIAWLFDDESESESAKGRER
jgi:transcriptional regulator with XRE-family HTH domain